MNLLNWYAAILPRRRVKPLRKNIQVKIVVLLNVDKCVKFENLQLLGERNGNLPLDNLIANIVAGHC